MAGRIAYVNPNFVQGWLLWKPARCVVRLEDEDYRLARDAPAEALVAQRQQALIREQAEALACRRRVAGYRTRRSVSPLTLREPQLAEGACPAGCRRSPGCARPRLALSRTRHLRPVQWPCPPEAG